ncbi:hypothetical protein PIB30_039729 [Stylosanthes scabra]|uniref:Uncharacterized protein n=1 Tax=Stylosanthes scabra TaxID=79078 RepID=A0ABU6REI0_9FABA|nr:hypothetical protein [Stylosanthes scabra]
MSVSLPGIMVSNMNTDPTKSKKHLLPFPMFITKWAEEANVHTYPGDEIWKIPKGQQFSPMECGKKNQGQPSPEPSRRELIRALKRNECIMRWHEQLLLLIHPGIDTSGLEQISSLEVSEHQQQAVGDEDQSAGTRADPEDEEGPNEDSSKE